MIALFVDERVDECLAKATLPVVDLRTQDVPLELFVIQEMTRVDVMGVSEPAERSQHETHAMRGLGVKAQRQIFPVHRLYALEYEPVDLRLWRFLAGSRGCLRGNDSRKQQHESRDRGEPSFSGALHRDLSEHGPSR